MTTIPLNTLQDLGFPLRLVILWFVLVTFDLVMKCIAAYKAGTRKQVARFICLFIFNTCGILPIIYLILKKEETQSK